MSFISSIGRNIGTFATRATGLAALGITCYDSHVLGKLEADTYSQSNEANRLTSAAYNNTYLNEPSVTMGKIKKKIFNFQVDNSIFMPFDAAIGYFKGFGSNFVDNFITAGLGLGALFGSRKVSAWSALGLIICGAYKLVNGAFGLSHHNRLNPPYK